MPELGSEFRLQAARSSGKAAKQASGKNKMQTEVEQQRNKETKFD
jgi:hypothetical protein